MQATLTDVPAAILAGGLGTRLRSCIAACPKVLAPVHGRPYLCYLLDQLANAGVCRVVLLTGYMADSVEAVFGAHYAGMQLAYSRETTPLGTGGALRNALPLLQAPVALVLNGDSYCDVALPDFWDFHCGEQATVSLVLTEVENASRFGVVHVSKARVNRFAEKQDTRGGGWINAGVYLIDRRQVQEIPPGRSVSLEREMFPTWSQRGCLHGFQSRGRFLDIGTPEAYSEASEFFCRVQCPGG